MTRIRLLTIGLGALVVSFASAHGATLEGDATSHASRRTTLSPSPTAAPEDQSPPSPSLGSPDRAASVSQEASPAAPSTQSSPPSTPTGGSTQDADSADTGEEDEPAKPAVSPSPGADVSLGM